MKKKCRVIILPQTIAYRFFLRGAQWQKEQLLVEIEKAESESFDCQMEIESKAPCQEQCEHCKEYYNSKFKFSMPIYTVPSIPTYKEINDTATEYAEEKCRIMGNIKCLTARKTAYIDGYQKALKDLGHIK